MPQKFVQRSVGRPASLADSGLAHTVRWYVDNRPWWQRIRSGVYDGERLGLVS